MFGGTYQDSNLVFCRPEEGYYRQDKMTARATELARKVGFQRASPCTCCDTATPLSFQIAALPGQSFICGSARLRRTVTLTIYSHALEVDEIAAAKVWNDARADIIQQDRQRNPEEI